MGKRLATKVSTFIATLAVLATGATGGLAQNAGVSFSATAVQVAPDQSRQVGTIAKNGTDMRLEFTQDGKTTIRILLPTQGILRLLDPATQSYIEFNGPATPPDAVNGAATPCPTATQGNPEMLCQRDGPNTVISGIQTERWVLSVPGQPGQQVVFWDPERSKALREEYPDGTVMQMAFVGMETLEGRAAEHWQVTVQMPGREPLRGDWWFDPEIRVVVRETMPDGSMRWLENIRVGPVDPALFTVPAGWQRQEPPAAAPQN